MTDTDKKPKNGVDGPSSPQREKLRSPEGTVPNVGGYPQEEAYRGYEPVFQEPLEHTAPPPPVEGGEARLPHVVKHGETAYGIAEKHGLSQEELLSHNGLKVVDPVRGLLSDGKGEFRLRPGMRLKIPPKEAGEAREKFLRVPPEKSEKIVGRARQKASSRGSGHMDSFFGEMLWASSLLLGPLADSELGYTLSVRIPVALGGNLSVAFEGSFEQKRKSGKHVEHKLKAGVGVHAKIRGLVDAEAMFGLFLQASSDDVNKSVALFSYGFYKFGRQIADELNDWGAAIGSSGVSVSSSMALYYGLNYMYSNKDGIGDRLSDIGGSEREVASSERELFGHGKGGARGPFDESNTNEASFGGSLKAGAKAGNDEIGTASIGGEIAYQNTVSAKSLNETGVYGEQKDQGFWKDYKLGAKSEASIKAEGSFSVGDVTVEYSQTAFFEKTDSKEPKNKELGRIGKSQGKNNGWAHSKTEFESKMAIRGMAEKSFQGEVLASFFSYVQVSLQKYNANRSSGKNLGVSSVLPELDSTAIAAQVGSSILDTALASVEKSLGEKSPLKVTESLQGRLKVLTEKERASKITLIIGRLSEKSIDFGLVGGKAVIFKPAASIDLSV